MQQMWPKLEIEICEDVPRSAEAKELVSPSSSSAPRGTRVSRHSKLVGTHLSHEGVSPGKAPSAEQIARQIKLQYPGGRIKEFSKHEAMGISNRAAGSRKPHPIGADSHLVCGTGRGACENEDNVHPMPDGHAADPRDGNYGMEAGYPMGGPGRKHKDIDAVLQKVVEGSNLWEAFEIGEGSKRSGKDFKRTTSAPGIRKVARSSSSVLGNHESVIALSAGAEGFCKGSSQHGSVKQDEHTAGRGGGVKPGSLNASAVKIGIPAVPRLSERRADSAPADFANAVSRHSYRASERARLDSTRLPREECKAVKHDKSFSDWQGTVRMACPGRRWLCHVAVATNVGVTATGVLVGPTDWRDHSQGKEGAARYRLANLPGNYFGPGVYELGLMAMPEGEGGHGGKSRRRGVDGRQVVVVYVGQAENVRQRLQKHGQGRSHLGPKVPLQAAPAVAAQQQHQHLAGRKSLSKTQQQQQQQQDRRRRASEPGSASSAGNLKIQGLEGCGDGRRCSGGAAGAGGWEVLPPLVQPDGSNHGAGSELGEGRKQQQQQELEEGQVSAVGSAGPGHSEARTGLLEDAFEHGYVVVFRWARAASADKAKQAEVQLLDTFDYPWNSKLNGSRRPAEAFVRLSRVGASRGFGCGLAHFSLFKPRPVGVALQVQPPLNEHFGTPEGRLVEVVEARERTSRAGKPSLRQAGTGKSPAPSPTGEVGGGGGGRASRSQVQSRVEAEEVLWDPTFGGKQCGAALVGGGVCPQKPEPSRKRCALHKGLRCSPRASAEGALVTAAAPPSRGR
eukprot:jgi/Mesen1/1194/ME000128S00168